MDDVKRYDLQQPDSHMGSAHMQPYRVPLDALMEIDDRRAA